MSSRFTLITVTVSPKTVKGSRNSRTRAVKKMGGKNARTRAGFGWRVRATHINTRALELTPAGG